MGITYNSYSFVDKDPIIDYVRTAVQRTGMTYKAVAGHSGVNVITIHKMLSGYTRRPQAATVNAILRTCDMKLAVRPINEPDMIPPTILNTPQFIPLAKYQGAAKAKKVTQRVKK